MRAQLAALSGQQRRWLEQQGAIRLGLCARDGRLQLLALRARTPTDGRCRLLARNLAIALQLHTADPLPIRSREPPACRAIQVVGLGTFVLQRHTIYLRPLHSTRPQHWRLPWSRRVVRLVA